jgi:predicted ATPase
LCARYIDELLCVRARGEVGFRRESRAAGETMYNVNILVCSGDYIEVVVCGASAECAFDAEECG